MLTDSLPILSVEIPKVPYVRLSCISFAVDSPWGLLSKGRAMNIEKIKMFFGKSQKAQISQNHEGEGHLAIT